MKTHYSPRQVARAIGVSESSLKRWCDDGLLPFVRTPGGHRRLSVQGVLSFVREQGKPIVDPEVIGLPSTSGRGEFVVGRARENLRTALVAGEEDACRQVLIDLHLAQIPMHQICDEVVAGAFHDIGNLWACDEVAIYQERRGCEIAVRALLELRRLASPEAIPTDAPVAIGGTADGDHYVLPTTMIELVLSELGWNSRSMGTSLPFPSLAEAVARIRPRVFWLSVSHVHDAETFARGLAVLREAVEALDVTTLLGGRALTDRLAAAIPSAAVCENFTDLVAKVTSSCDDR